MNINLNEFAGGILQEKFEHGFERVMENLLDPNTPYKDKRELIIQIKFEQNEQRTDVAVDVAVKEKLASQGKLTTRFSVAKDLRTGKVIAEEYGKQLRGQMSMADVEEEEDLSIDPETGEVLEDNNIVDFRKIQEG